MTSGGSSTDPRRALGSAGERYAARYLEVQGYRILARNVRLRGGEIDIVAEHDGSLVFIEVRLRRRVGVGVALESVARVKQARLRRLALEYCAGLAAPPESMRIDVVAVALDARGRVEELRVIQNAVQDG